jgi:hypothetical protein
MIAPPPQLTEERTATLTALADAVVPASGVMPSASEAGVAAKWADRALATLPDHAAAKLAQILDEAHGRDPAGEVRRLAEQDQDGLEVLLLVVIGAYYMSPKVRRRLGYPGQKRNPPFEDEADYYLDGGLLDPVVSRGPIYRPTPGRS